MKHVVFAAIAAVSFVLSVEAGESVQRFDFQPDSGRLEPGHVAVTPQTIYSARRGYGFTRAPTEAVDGSRHAWAIFGRRVRVSEAIPSAVLSDATRDAVGVSRGTQSFTFRTDVDPGAYDVTVWLGNVTRPLFQLRATVNDAVIDVERMDVLITRGRLDSVTLPDGRTPSIGNAVPRTVRVDACDGVIEITVGPGDRTDPITWDFVLEDASHISQYASIKFADGIWNSNIIDRQRGYQAQYADVGRFQACQHGGRSALCVEQSSRDR